MMSKSKRPAKTFLKQSFFDISDHISFQQHSLASSLAPKSRGPMNSDIYFYFFSLNIISQLYTITFVQMQFLRFLLRWRHNSRINLRGPLGKLLSLCGKAVCSLQLIFKYCTIPQKESRYKRRSKFYPSDIGEAGVARGAANRHYFSLSVPFPFKQVYNNQLYRRMAEPNPDEQEDYLHQEQAKAKYSKTSMKKKEQLIDLVTNQSWSIYKASKKLKLSNSTAKSILRNFQKYGTLLEKFTKNRILKLREMERSQQITPKPIPAVKTDENLEIIAVKEEHEPGDEKEFENQQHNANYYPFFSYSLPIYFQFQP